VLAFVPFIHLQYMGRRVGKTSPPPPPPTAAFKNLGHKT
jgi:hypothetical protein